MPKQTTHGDRDYVADFEEIGKRAKELNKNVRQIVGAAKPHDSRGLDESLRQTEVS